MAHKAKLRKITVYFKSDTDAKTFYKTERHRNGMVTCFCPGFVYKRTCWHTKRAKSYSKA